MKIATWNVNSLKVRLPQVTEWLQSAQPDVLVLQEIKQLTETFPVDAFADLGYQAMASGQKTYNGVATVSRTPMHDAITDIPGLDDPQRRVLATTIDGVRVINLNWRSTSAWSCWAISISRPTIAMYTIRQNGRMTSSAVRQNAQHLAN